MNAAKKFFISCNLTQQRKCIRRFNLPISCNFVQSSVLTVNQRGSDAAKKMNAAENVETERNRKKEIRERSNFVCIEKYSLTI